MSRRARSNFPLSDSSIWYYPIVKLFDKIDWPAPGRYVVAVSGGVDSVALLDLLVWHTAVIARNEMTKQSLAHKDRRVGRLRRPPRDDEKEYSLIVAHVDHGWRQDSDEDRRLVEKLAA